MRVWGLTLLVYAFAIAALCTLLLHFTACYSCISLHFTLTTTGARLCGDLKVNFTTACICAATVLQPLHCTTACILLLHCTTACILLHRPSQQLEHAFAAICKVFMRQRSCVHTSAYVSMRQHTSAFAAICDVCMRQRSSKVFMINSPFF